MGKEMCMCVCVCMHTHTHTHMPVLARVCERHRQSHLRHLAPKETELSSSGGCVPLESCLQLQEDSVTAEKTGFFRQGWCNAEIA